MPIHANTGLDLTYPFDLLPGGMLVLDGPAAARGALVDDLAQAAYGGPDPFWRVPPVITARPALADPDADALHHRHVVRPAREDGRFVVCDGCWAGRLLGTDLRGPALRAVLAERRARAWGDDQPSLLVALLDGDPAHARVWVEVAAMVPTVLLPSRLTRAERLEALFAELRRYRLHGRLV